MSKLDHIYQLIAANIFIYAAILLTIFFIAPSFAFAASYATGSAVDRALSGPTDSFTYTVPSGSDQMLYIGFVTDGAPCGSGGFTYDSVPMTYVSLGTAGEYYACYAYLVAPSQGAHTLSGSSLGGGTYSVATFNDIDQSTPLTEGDHLAGTGGSVTLSVATVDSTDIVVGTNYFGTAAQTCDGTILNPDTGYSSLCYKTSPANPETVQFSRGSSGPYEGFVAAFHSTAAPPPPPPPEPSSGGSNGIFMWGTFLFALTGIMWRILI